MGSTNIAGADLDACASLSKVEDLQGGPSGEDSDGLGNLRHFSWFQTGRLDNPTIQISQMFEVANLPDFEQGGLGGMSKNRCCLFSAEQEILGIIDSHKGNSSRLDLWQLFWLLSGMS